MPQHPGPTQLEWPPLVRYQFRFGMALLWSPLGTLLLPIRVDNRGATLVIFNRILTLPPRRGFWYISRSCSSRLRDLGLHSPIQRRRMCNVTLLSTGTMMARAKTGLLIGDLALCSGNSSLRSENTYEAAGRALQQTTDKTAPAVESSRRRFVAGPRSVRRHRSTTLLTVRLCVPFQDVAPVR